MRFRLWLRSTQLPHSHHYLNQKLTHTYIPAYQKNYCDFLCLVTCFVTSWFATVRICNWSQVSFMRAAATVTAWGWGICDYLRLSFSVSGLRPNKGLLWIFVAVVVIVLVVWVMSKLIATKLWRVRPMFLLLMVVWEGRINPKIIGAKYRDYSKHTWYVAML